MGRDIGTFKAALSRIPWDSFLFYRNYHIFFVISLFEMKTVNKTEYAFTVKALNFN